MDIKAMETKHYKIETTVPEEYVDDIIEALNETGALTIGGNYDHCVFCSKGKGSWRPLEGANPFIGNVGDISNADEIKIEFTCNRELVKEAIDVIKKHHPYEEPVITILPAFSAEDIWDGMEHK